MSARPNLDLILGKRDPAEISAAYAQYIGALDAAIAVAESAAARPMVAQAKLAARSESVADRALRDGTTFANLEYATNWTPERLKEALAKLCVIAANMARNDARLADTSEFIDAADEALETLLDVPAEPDADPRHTAMEAEWKERAREDRA